LEDRNGRVNVRWMLTPSTSTAVTCMLPDPAV
jgi:hypothetical protein